MDNLKMRDDVDSNRKENPLVVAKDAIIIDTTNLSLEQQFEMVLDYVRKVIKD
ncbi:MAG: (d)CMP kinase [Bacteroidota bacterium]|nr:(d)CMP kinase [Bacteroidota bacterium]